MYLDGLSLQCAQSGVGIKDEVGGRGVEGPASNSISGSAEADGALEIVDSSVCPAASGSDAVAMMARLKKSR